LNPAKYAIVIGKRDREQGPKLVRSPPKKTNIKVNALGSFKPWLIKSSLLRARSDIAIAREEMVISLHGYSI